MMHPDHIALIQITLLAGAAAIMGEHLLHLLRFVYRTIIFYG